QQATPGFEDQPVRSAFLKQQMRDAASGVAASGNFAAVHIEDSHSRDGPACAAFRSRRFDGQQLLASDADGRVADAHYILPCEGTAIHPAIEDDEVVA